MRHMAYRMVMPSSQSLSARVQRGRGGAKASRRPGSTGVSEEGTDGGGWVAASSLASIARCGTLRLLQLSARSLDLLALARAIWRWRAASVPHLCSELFIPVPRVFSRLRLGSSEHTPSICFCYPAAVSLYLHHAHLSMCECERGGHSDGMRHLLSSSVDALRPVVVCTPSPFRSDHSSTGLLLGG